MWKLTKLWERPWQTLGKFMSMTKNVPTQFIRQVNDMSFVLHQRALFQANNDIHVLGDSKTNVYAYSLWLHAVPMVCIVDTTAMWNPKEQWLAASTFDIFLSGPCYLWACSKKSPWLQRLGLTSSSPDHDTYDKWLHIWRHPEATELRMAWRSFQPSANSSEMLVFCTK